MNIKGKALALVALFGLLSPPAQAAFPTFPAPSGGGGGGTVTTSGLITGDGSVGTPVTNASQAASTIVANATTGSAAATAVPLGTGLAFSAGSLVNTAPKGPDTLLLLPNSASANVTAGEEIYTLTTNTAGSEASKYVLKLLSGGVQVVAMQVNPTQTYFPVNVDQRVPGVAFVTSGNTGLNYLPTGGTSGTPALQFAVNNGVNSSSTMFLDSNANLVLQNTGGGAHVWFGNDTTESIGHSAGAAAILVFNNGNASGSMSFQISAAERIGISHAGDVLLGVPSPATNATSGFVYIPASAGAPTGTVTAPTGQAAIAVDKTNHKLYHNDGSGWILAD